MLSGEIRKRFLEFFEKRGHTVVPSDLLVPMNDPTLLFTGAGMNQFKDQFMGKDIVFKRAASCQKCLRTGDLENVGRTPRHHTFFEMLGNFSFGDYFKKDAIKWAWEFMTREMGFSPEKLWVSVYKEDEESYAIWLNEVKVPARRIVKLGPDSNFWPADAPSKGPNGPCGPCSEIYFDWGPKTGCGKPDCDPSCDCGRFLEVWNLVFTEFERRPDGTLVPLPNKNIDTGMGLERITSVVQNVPTNFDTDLFTPIIDRVKRELGAAAKDISPSNINLIVDHLRASVFSIGDGVSPSNEKRGYVVRKLIRRAYLKSGSKKPFLYNIVPTVVGLLKDVYPELEEKREHISAIIEEEEKKFSETIESVFPVFEEMLSKCEGVLQGEDIFKLVDTYGLPFDMIVEEAEARKVKPDITAFEKCMEARKEESRQGSNISSDFIFQPDLFMNAPKPACSSDLPLETEIAFILKAGTSSGEMSEGERAEMITSPQSGELYAEGGGQVGDTGDITKDDGRINILNTYDAGGRKVMEVFVVRGNFKKGDKVRLDIDREKKKRTAMNHTATHLLQAALRSVLGEHVKQSGSLVDDKRLRFDFTHMKKLSDRDLRKVEDTINTWIGKKMSVCKESKPIQKAKEEGALSFFGEKYGDVVRVVSVSDVSKEFCGGTHVDNTSEIELVKITSESSVASGVRRIEMVTGGSAREWLKEKLAGMLSEYERMAGDIGGTGNLENSIPQLREALGMAKRIIEGSVRIDSGTMRDFEDVIGPAFAVAAESVSKIKKEREKSEEADAFTRVKEVLDRVLEKAPTVSGVKFVSGVFQGADMPVLRKAIAVASKKLGSGVLFLGGSKDDRTFLICSVTSDLVGKGLSAKTMVSKSAVCVKGGGGGNDEFAQAGGTYPAGLEKAVDECKKAIEEWKG